MKRGELPDVLRDVAINKLITGKLIASKQDGDSLEACLANTWIDRTVEQLRMYFEDAYRDERGGDSDGNVKFGNGFVQGVAS